MKKLIYQMVYLLFTISSVIAQWVQMSNGMGNNISVLSLAVNGNTIFAPASNRVYRSSNYGISWVSAGITNQGVSCKLKTRQQTP